VRIRQVRPEFFSDPVLGSLTPDARLTYIGLWCIADDAGWLEWDLSSIATMLCPYESVRVRDRRVLKAAESLVGAGRVQAFDCGCAFIPRLADHQKIGGNKSFTSRERHERHRSPDKSIHSRTSPPVGSNGSEVVKARERTTKEEADELAAAYRRQGLPVDLS
jgi:hypothetical protein